MLKTVLDYPSRLWMRASFEARIALFLLFVAVVLVGVAIVEASGWLNALWLVVFAIVLVVVCDLLHLRYKRR